MRHVGVCWWGIMIWVLFADAALVRYLACVGERWTEEAILRESERWVHVPRDGKCIEDERRLLVHLPKRWGTSRVWRSRAADEERASDLIEETVGEVRAAGGGRILWHTGDRVAPPFMDECLARHGFRTTEKLEVLAFLPGNGQGRLPWIGVPGDLSFELVRDAEVLREALRVDSEVFRSPPPTGGEFAGYAGELEKLRRREHGEHSRVGASLAVRFAAYVNPSLIRSRQPARHCGRCWCADSRRDIEVVGRGNAPDVQRPWCISGACPGKMSGRNASRRDPGPYQGEPFYVRFHTEACGFSPGWHRAAPHAGDPAPTRKERLQRVGRA
jgi:hypothetical protein